MAAARVERLGRVASLPMVSSDLIGTKITIALVSPIRTVLLVCRRIISFSVMIVGSMNSALMMILITALPPNMMSTL